MAAAGNVNDELGGTVVLADLWRAAARPGKARQLLVSALEAAHVHGASANRATAELHVALSELHCEKGQLEEARAHLEAAAVLQEHTPQTESLYLWFVASALLVSVPENPSFRVIVGKSTIIKPLSLLTYTPTLKLSCTNRAGAVVF